MARKRPARNTDGTIRKKDPNKIDYDAWEYMKSRTKDFKDLIEFGARVLNGRSNKKEPWTNKEKLIVWKEMMSWAKDYTDEDKPSNVTIGTLILNVQERAQARKLIEEDITDAEVLGD